MSALRATVDLGQLIRSAPLAPLRDLIWPQNRVRLLPTKEASRRAVRLHRSGPTDSRTLPPCDPIFFHQAAILSIIRPFFGQDCTERWRLVDPTDSRPSPSDDIGRKGRRQ